MEKITIEGIEAEITKKRIKNLYIRILPPEGRVCISAPQRMSKAEINKFAKSKIEWIRSHKEKYKNSQVTVDLSYTSGESIYYMGRKYRLEVIFSKNNAVQLLDDKLLLRVKEGSTAEKRKQVINEWYREKLKQEIIPLMEKWQKIIGVHASGWGVKNMKTRWGSCNVKTKRIWLSLRLIQKHPRFLEYVVVHELVHLLERKHNKIFTEYMERFLPGWKTIREELNYG